MVLKVVPWVGFGYPWLGSALFFILGTPVWYTGIIPCLILKILLLKGTLLLGPPIALGAFVLGQGSGLLIGKLLGIKLVLSALHHERHGNHAHFGHNAWKANAWKSLTDAVGWKAERLRSKLPFLRKWRLHPTFSPPIHFDFYSFPPIRHVKYTDKPYGTYKYAPEDWNQGSWDIVDTSDWLSGPGPNYAGTWRKSQRVPPDATSSLPHLDSTAHANYNVTPTHSTENSLEGSNLEEVSFSSDVKNFIRAEVYKLRSGKYGDKISEAEMEEVLKELINEQFARDLMESIEQNRIPEFVPFPDRDNQTSNPESRNKGEQKRKEEDEGSSMTNFVLSSVLSSIQDLNPLNFLPETLLSWLSPTGTKETAESKAAWKSRQKRGTNGFNVAQLTESVATDIRNLFSIISFLDISRCLEKMVCEIHSRGKDFTSRQLANSYEGNVLIAFRILDSIMGKDPDKNVMKYRKAARLGEKENSPEVCLKKFPVCPISTNKLISLGNIVTPASKSTGRT